MAFIFPGQTKEIYFNSKDYITGLFKKSEPEQNIKTVSNINDTLKKSVKTIVTDTTFKPIENKVENNLKSSNENENITKTQVNNIVDDNKKFHIIVGCFRSKKNADNYFKTIESKGYTPRLFEAGSDGLYKISCGSYATDEEANTAIKKVFKDIGPQAWILKK